MYALQRETVQQTANELIDYANAASSRPSETMVLDDPYVPLPDTTKSYRFDKTRKANISSKDTRPHGIPSRSALSATFKERFSQIYPPSTAMRCMVKEYRKEELRLSVTIQSSRDTAQVVIAAIPLVAHGTMD